MKKHIRQIVCCCMQKGKCFLILGQLIDRYDRCSLTTWQQAFTFWILYQFLGKQFLVWRFPHFQTVASACFVSIWTILWFLKIHGRWPLCNWAIVWVIIIHQGICLWQPSVNPVGTGQFKQHLFNIVCQCFLNINFCSYNMYKGPQIWANNNAFKRSALNI